MFRDVSLQEWCSGGAQWWTNSTVVFWSPGAGQTLSRHAGPVSTITGAMRSRSHRWAATHTALLFCRFLFYTIQLFWHPNVRVNIWFLKGLVILMSLSGWVRLSSGIFRAGRSPQCKVAIEGLWQHWAVYLYLQYSSTNILQISPVIKEPINLLIPLILMSIIWNYTIGLFSNGMSVSHIIH